MPVDCPRNIAEGYLARPDWRLPPLSGVLSAPTLRRDGSLLTTPGYDKATGLYDGPSQEFLAVPEKPIQDDARAALAVLNEFDRRVPIRFPMPRVPSHRQPF